MAVRVCGSILGAIVLLFALPALAAAKPGCHHHHRIPHNSEVAQYSEVIPGDCGSQTPNPSSNTSPGGPSDGSIPPGTLQQLQSQGPAGVNAAGLAEANTPPSAGAGKARPGTGGEGQGATSHGSQSGAKGGSSAGGRSDGSFLSGLVDALGGSGGAGIILPLVLGATLLAGLAYWLARRRRTAATG